MKKFGPAKLDPSSYSNSGLRRPTSGTLNHVSKLNASLGPKSNSGETGMRTPSSCPSKNNAWPTNPFVKTGLPTIVPVLVPTISVLAPSSDHHAASPLSDVQPGEAGWEFRLRHFP